MDSVWNETWHSGRHFGRGHWGCGCVSELRCETQKWFGGICAIVVEEANKQQCCSLDVGLNSAPCFHTDMRAVCGIGRCRKETIRGRSRSAATFRSPNSSAASPPSRSASACHGRSFETGKRCCSSCLCPSSWKTSSARLGYIHYVMFNKFMVSVWRRERVISYDIWLHSVQDIPWSVA